MNISLVRIATLYMVSCAVTVFGQTVTVTPSTTTLRPEGGIVTFTVNATFTESALFGLDVTVPNDWSYVSGTTEPSIKPEVGQRESFGWTAINAVTSPVLFTFSLSYPAGTIAAGAAYSVVFRQNGVRTILTPPASSFGKVIIPQVTTQPGAQSIKLGANITFTVNATGTAPLSYQWLKDGVAISGATNASYTLAAVTPEDAADYTAVITNAAGSVTTTVATLAVAPLVIIPH